MQKESQEKESFEHFSLNKKWYKRNREESEAFQLSEEKKGWVKKREKKGSGFGEWEHIFH